MIARALALLMLAAFVVPAAAQEKITVGTQQSVASAPLFLADAAGYFKAEGLQVEMTAYRSADEVAQALAGGATDLGIADFTATAFTLAGKGAIKAIAGAEREKRDYEGNEVVVSNAAYGAGLRKLDDLANRIVAVTELGSTQHYEVGQIAQAKRFDLSSVTLKPLGTLDRMANAVRTGDVDAAILPAKQARELMVSGQARLVGWISEIVEQQLGALFASTKAIEGKRTAIEKFVHAYRRGAADYAAALLRHDSYGKRTLDAKAHAAAATIARYAYPGHSSAAADAVEAGVVYIDAQARLDAADVARQFAWFKAQGLAGGSAEPGEIVDMSFAK